MVAAKGGTKLHASADDAKHGISVNGNSKGRHMIGNSSLDSLAESLSRGLDRPVVNMTEIPGKFEYDMEWSSEETAASEFPTLFTVIQQKLGLKLEARKLPVEVLVIDHAEKIATEN